MVFELKTNQWPNNNLVNVYKSVKISVLERDQFNIYLSLIQILAPLLPDQDLFQILEECFSCHFKFDLFTKEKFDISKNLKEEKHINLFQHYLKFLTALITNDQSLSSVISKLGFRFKG